MGQVRLSDVDQSGYWHSISLLNDDGVEVWTRTPPTSEPGDVWTAAEFRDGQVVGWTWSCHVVTFNAAGQVVSVVFTK